MKSKFILITVLIFTFLFASCSFNPKTNDIESTQEQTTDDNPNDHITEPTEPDETSEIQEPMYQKYILDEEILISAGLPIVSVTTENNTKIESKENWIPATMKITNATDESWNFDEIDISIRGRGNSTWGQAKKPFAIKLSKKQKICGMPKHKRWVLIANYLDNSFMKNATAFYLSKKLGMNYTVRGEYVNLVLNGNYVGLYWLGEAIKVDENRVNIDEENDFLVEMDIYYDETWKFKSEIKNLPYMIKNDEFMTEEKLSTLKDRISEMEDVLYSENFPYKNENNVEIDTSFSDYIDLTSFAQFYLVNEIMYNGELGHPKSCYFTFESDTGILSAGPVWDFDWAACSSAQTLLVKNTIYYDSLFKIPSFNEKITELTSLIDEDDISSEIESIRTQIRKSVELDGNRWGTENRNPLGEKRSNFDEYVDYLKDCTISRINFVKNEF